MPLTAFTSLATYTAVLAESLAAIGLSSLAPSLLATIGKLAKCAVEEDDGALRAAAQAQVDNLIRGLGKLAGPTREGSGAPVPSPAEVVGGLFDALSRGLHSIEQIDLLVPKTASLETEFEFHASESYGGQASVGGMIQVVTLQAGFHALYEASSRNRIRMKIDFVSVPFDLRCRKALSPIGRQLMQVLGAAGISVTPQAEALIGKANEAKLVAALGAASASGASLDSVLAALA
jgi:hypothetical protein